MDQETLLPIIQQWVELNTMIWTDIKAGYQNLPQLGFAHEMVNHNLYFVAPLIWVTLNRVEAMWGRAKVKFNAMYGPTNQEVEDYLSEFMWSQRFSDKPFVNFWYQTVSDGSWSPCERAVDTGRIRERDEERVPGTSPCNGPRDIAADHPAMGGTQHNDMDGYQGRISEPATAWTVSDGSWSPCERAVDTGRIRERDEERVPGTSPCNGPRDIAADHPAMGGTQHNDMDGYQGRISEPATAWTMRELNMNEEHTIVDWNQFCRDAAVQHFLNHPKLLGGNRYIVKIDERLEQWILDGYEKETKKGFLVPVPAMDQDTLLPIIQQWVELNTMIWTDIKAGYQNLPQLGFAHEMVNHNLYFVAPLIWVTLNRVEAMWRRAKVKFKAMNYYAKQDHYLTNKVTAMRAPITAEEYLSVVSDGIFNLPEPKTLPKSPDLLFENNPDQKIEHFFVCDDTFHIGIHLIKPYSKRKLMEEQSIFSYRL
eukprot:gene5714-10965_t